MTNRHKIMILFEKWRVIIMRKLIENFNTQKKCDEYRKQLGDREWEIYWKDTGEIGRAHV